MWYQKCNSEMLYVGSVLKLALIQHRHFHPSGNLQPSKEDIRLTDRLIHLTELMGIPLLDHIIVGGDNHQFFSMKEKGMMQNSVISYVSDYHILDFGFPATKEEAHETKRKGR